MAYTGIKKVRAVNGQHFIDDFKSVRTIVILPEYTPELFVTGKLEVWEVAKHQRITYTMRTDVFKNGRLVLVIR